MKSKLFIPTKIRVGYQKREDTYTKKLAYVIYYDAKGVLRKEGSFESWRHKDIEVEEFENKPTSGFVLNKGILRDGYYGNGHNMVRVYDERGIEFEITVGNLLFILMTTNCQKRGLEGDFVYAWNGAELVLLPCDCDEYKNSVDYTSLQSQKVSTKDLVAGCCYQTKSQKLLIYLGKFNWYVFEYSKDDSWNKEMVTKKMFIFIDEEKKIHALSSLTNFANKITDTTVDNYAELMDIFKNDIHSSPFVKFELQKFILKNNYYQKLFLPLENGIYKSYCIQTENGYDKISGKYVIIGYYIYEDSMYSYEKNLLKETKIRNNKIKYYHDPKKGVFIKKNNFWESDTDKKVYTLEEVESMGFYSLEAVLENGMKVLINKL